MKPSKCDQRKLIPRGLYCYERIAVTPNKNPKKPPKYKVAGICPFWSIDKSLPKRENGCCSYLRTNDWEINEKHGDLHWRNKVGKVVTITKPHEIPISLLWDQVKDPRCPRYA